MSSNDVFSLGFTPELDRSLTPTAVGFSPPAALQPSLGTYQTALPSGVEEQISPTMLGAGAMASVLFSGKLTFTSTTSGYRMGIDESDGIYKWIIGGASSSIDWAVTTADTLTIVGKITATSGTIGGWTIGATTLTATGIILDAGNQSVTGGTIQTATSGQRIRILAATGATPTQVANSLALIDSSNNILVQFGDLSNALINLNAITAIQAIAATTAANHSTPFVSIDSSHTSATGGGMFIDYDGSGTSVLTLNSDSTTNTAAICTLNTDAVQNTNFRLVFSMNGTKVWRSDGSDPNGVLSSASGDICINCGNTNSIKACTGTTVWVGL